MYAGFLFDRSHEEEHKNREEARPFRVTAVGSQVSDWLRLRPGGFCREVMGEGDQKNMEYVRRRI